MLHQLVAFTLGEQRYALPLTTVQRVVRMVEVTPLPKAPEIVLGVIDFQGNIIPVMRPGLQYVEGITRLENGILFIHNLEHFLSNKEEQQLDGLLAQAAGKK